MRAQFIASDIGNGLRRNLTMTIAVVVTTAVSLTFFGASLLLRKQVDLMKTYWYDKVEVSIFLCDDLTDSPRCAKGPVTEAERQAIRTDLDKTAEVKKVYFEDKKTAFAHYQEQFKGTALVQNVTADDMPESYRVKLKDPEKFDIIYSAFYGRDGVDDVQDQKALLDRFFAVLRGFQLAALVVAVVMLVAATLMISNTIRVAAFSRRRETGIMRLVGASNFYIQLPFILEGAIAGLIGGGLAAAAIVAMEKFVVIDRMAHSFRFTKFIRWDAVWTTVPWIMLLGVALSSLASFVTLRKYLRV